MTSLQLVPLGTILAWVSQPSKTGQIVDLPPGWQRCSATIILITFITLVIVINVPIIIIIIISIITVTIFIMIFIIIINILNI